ncbi:P-II family nitrogen regulator [Actinomycetospora straminea]|uniref:Nitrogen regulatory protein P-II n=1 Tax=Actinomycetospora straminea TaxID=663607 RepID=A0ABP9E2X0_9PSEU|nr:P-II family nitrogen regulator [Actinomycetospora straminea]MDD7931364.1 P-II family nitrogen regulator [Actinomycetospora straminea]
MKTVHAMIPPHALDGVRRALERHAVLGMTIAEVSTLGASGSRSLRRGQVVEDGLAPCLRIETIVHDELVDRVVDEIAAAVHPDGRLWVTPLDLVLRVRTGERGADAV